MSWLYEALEIWLAYTALMLNVFELLLLSYLITPCFFKKSKGVLGFVGVLLLLDIAEEVCILLGLAVSAFFSGEAGVIIIILLSSIIKRERSAAALIEGRWRPVPISQNELARNYTIQKSSDFSHSILLFSSVKVGLGKKIQIDLILSTNVRRA
jgi:hypothetical protein